MSNPIESDFFYGNDGDIQSFFRVPKRLVRNARYKALSGNAKLLYGLFLDRMDLSSRNGWRDEYNRVYIYYPVKEIQEELHCGKNTPSILINELLDIGLIEKRHPGLGRPDVIYVKTIISDSQPDKSESIQEHDCVVGNPASRKTGSQSPEIRDAGLPENGKPVSRNSGGPIRKNKTDMNQTEYIYPSIQPTQVMETREHGNDGMDGLTRDDVRSVVEENISGDILRDRYDPTQVDEIAALITDTLCTTKDKVKIGGEVRPVGVVRGQFNKLEFEHVADVLACMAKNTSEVKNIKAYLLAALYNAPMTLNLAQQADTNHVLPEYASG